MSVRLRVFLLITSIVLVITASSVGISIFFAQKQNIKEIETDMLLVASLADEIVSGKISLLKANAEIIAQTLLNVPLKGLETVMEEQLAAYGDFTALAIFNDRRELTAACGKNPTPPEIIKSSEYGELAFTGVPVISTTRYSASGEIVFYIWVPMMIPGADAAPDRILSVTLPGMYFSDLLNKFVVWETGHVTLDDKDGTVIANVREEWVRNRINLLELSKTDRQYEDAAGTVKRMIAGETGVGRFALGGVERICAFRPVSRSLVGWSLGVIAPLAESPVSRVRGLLLTGGAFFLGLGILSALLASGSIARPFYHIQEQNVQLAELSEEARSASKAKSAFLANMSHEMRTPLNAVIGLSELSLAKTGVPEPVEKNLEKIYSSGITLLSIVNDLLDISKIESGKFEIISAEYDLPSLINDTVNLNIVRIGSKPITFTLSLDGNLPVRLSGDELRIKQIFNNLLSNACKYTRQGSVEWRITTEEDGETVWLIASVRDTGIGIKPEDMDKLFTDYNRLDAGKNRNLEGTGLGLALSQKMARFMGGAITVESEYGKGSVFTARIKQQRVTDETIGEDAAENLKKFQYSDTKRRGNVDLPRIQLPGARVLVVDDVEINLDVACGMMESYGMTIDTASSGRQAVELVRKADPRYDAIFMDHMMPDIDGFEAVRIIREEIGADYAKTVPIIALTANAITGSSELFTGKGFQDFLSKPMDILRLDEVIRRWVKRGKAG